MKKNSTGKVIYEVITMILALALIVVVESREYIFPADSFFLKIYGEEMQDDLWAKLIRSGLTLLMTLGVVNFANMIARIAKNTKSNSAKTWMLLIGNALKYLFIIIGLIAVLSCFGVNTSALVTGVGMLTLIVGLGCQSIVSDVVAGISIMLEKKFLVGDVVVIDGWRGTVQEIGLRTTSIIDAMGNVKIVNNSKISDIINNTRALSVAVCEVGIEYCESIERVEKIFEEYRDKIKESIPAIVEGPTYLGVSALAESSVNLKFIAKCREEDKFQTERDLNRAIKLMFDENGVNIPFNQIVLNYRASEEVSPEGKKSEE